MTRIDVFGALAIGVDGITARIADMMAARPQHDLWVQHLDVDVMDRSVMPAVDFPGAPGIVPDDLVAILRPLIQNRRCRGMTATVFDPDLDPDGSCARLIVSPLARLPFPAT